MTFSSRVLLRCSLRPLRFAYDAAEADVARGRVDGLGVARCGPVAPAVVRRAEMRAALQHLARNADIGLAGVVALLRARPAGILRNAAGLRRIRRMLRRIPIGGPLPHVADH